MLYFSPALAVSFYKLLIFSKKIVFFPCISAIPPIVPLRNFFPRSNSERIVGGKNATKNQFPYQVRLEWSYPGEPDGVLFCGGAIVSPQYVVTAGQCVTEAPNYGTLRIVAGVTDRNVDEPVLRNVNSSVVHPLFPG